MTEDELEKKSANVVNIYGRYTIEASVSNRDNPIPIVSTEKLQEAIDIFNTIIKSRSSSLLCLSISKHMSVFKLWKKDTKELHINIDDILKFEE